jgi:type IV pilus assembly protein PilF
VFAEPRAAPLTHIAPCANEARAVDEPRTLPRFEAAPARIPMSERLDRTQRGRFPRPAERRVVSALIAVGLAVLFGLPACFGPDPNTPGGNPDRMSRSEYDLAKDLWLRQHHPREALAHALKAVDLDGHNADAEHLVALIYLNFCEAGPNDCHLDQAEKYCRMALNARHPFREATNTLGVILIHEKRYDDAIATLRPLTTDILYETPENAWGNLGWAYLEKGELSRAIDALQRSVAAQPRFCVGNYRLGQAFDRNKQPESALEAYSRALKTKGCGGLQAAYAGRARVLIELGRSDPARADLDRCVKLDQTTDAGKECSSMLQNLK